MSARDYQATRYASLETHENSVHEGVKYSCALCKYQASSYGYPTKHGKVAHEAYPCELCEY